MNEVVITPPIICHLYFIRSPSLSEVVLFTEIIIPQKRGRGKVHNVTGYKCHDLADAQLNGQTYSRLNRKYKIMVDKRIKYGII